MNDAWTSSNASRENKSRVNVKSGGRGENELCGWQLSFTLYSLKSLPCVCALCFLPSWSLCASTFVRAEKPSLLMFLHYSRKSVKIPLFSCCDSILWLLPSISSLQISSTAPMTWMLTSPIWRTRYLSGQPTRAGWWSSKPWLPPTTSWCTAMR